VLAGEVSAFSAIFSYSSQSLTEAGKSKFSYTEFVLSGIWVVFGYTSVFSKHPCKSVHLFTTVLK